MFPPLRAQMMSTSELISCILVIYIQPVLCLIGILFNSACLGIFVVVWNNHEFYRKTSLILYLGAMCLCNTFQLLLSFLVIVAPGIEQFIDDIRYPSEAHAITEFNAKSVDIFYPLMMAANYASVWLLTLVCIQRFHSVCHPSNPWKRRTQFVRHTKLCIIFCILLAIFVNSVRWWELEKASNNDEQITESSLRFSTIYIVLQEVLLYGFGVYVIPISLLICFNYHTLRLIAESLEQRQLFHSRMPAEHRTALMMSVAFCVFFICATMSIFLRISMIAFGNLFQYAQFAWLPDLSNLLMNANCLVMPIVCFIFTRGFHDLFFALRHSSETSTFLPAKNHNSYTKHQSLPSDDVKFDSS